MSWLLLSLLVLVFLLLLLALISFVAWVFLGPVTNTGIVRLNSTNSSIPARSTKIPPQNVDAIVPTGLGDNRFVQTLIIDGKPVVTHTDRLSKPQPPSRTTERVDASAGVARRTAPIRRRRMQRQGDDTRDAVPPAWIDEDGGSLQERQLAHVNYRRAKILSQPALDPQVLAAAAATQIQPNVQLESDAGPIRAIAAAEEPLASPIGPASMPRLAPLVVTAPPVNEPSLVAKPLDGENGALLSISSDRPIAHRPKSLNAALSIPAPPPLIETEARPTADDEDPRKLTADRVHAIRERSLAIQTRLRAAQLAAMVARQPAFVDDVKPVPLVQSNSEARPTTTTTPTSPPDAQPNSESRPADAPSNSEGRPTPTAPAHAQPNAQPNFETAPAGAQPNSETAPAGAQPSFETAPAAAQPNSGSLSTAGRPNYDDTPGGPALCRPTGRLSP